VNINLTLIGQSIAFLFFVLFCMKYVWPFITAAMDERTKRIAAGLQAADRAEKDLELAQHKVVEQLTLAKKEASVIIDQANKRAIEIVEKLQRKQKLNRQPAVRKKSCAVR
jgi:F-type H+-transporting ATPase subunit b